MLTKRQTILIADERKELGELVSGSLTSGSMGGKRFDVSPFINFSSFSLPLIKFEGIPAHGDD